MDEEILVFCLLVETALLVGVFLHYKLKVMKLEMLIDMFKENANRDKIEKFFHAVWNK